MIELPPRQLHTVGSAPHTDEAFVLQVARHLANGTDGVLGWAVLPDLRPRSEVE